MVQTETPPAPGWWLGLNRARIPGAGRPRGEGRFRSRKGEGEELDPGRPPAGLAGTIVSRMIPLAVSGPVVITVAVVGALVLLAIVLRLER